MRQGGEAVKRVANLAPSILLYLLLGAILNVAVVSTLAVFFPVNIEVTHMGMYSFVPSAPVCWQTAVIRTPTALLVDADEWRYETIPRLDKDLPSWSVTRFPPSPSNRGHVREIAYGWPMLTAYSRSYVDNDRFPTQPLWIGVCGNSIFYSMVAAVGVLTFRAIGLRRRWRIKRGLCPACAYDLRGGNHAACPECGKVSASFAPPGR
jgi:hypothetical protein